MRLELDETKCNFCNKCLRMCPHKLLNIRVISCKHCPPEEAACLAACKKEAIYEIAKGILAINEAKCDGCGLCATACKEQAISIVKGKAKKCDLCAENDFFIACMHDCKNGAISLKNTVVEEEAIERQLEWIVKKIKSSEIKRILKKADDFEIIEDWSNEKIYCLTGFPELTLQEAQLINEVTEEFREEQESSELQALLEKTFDRYCERNHLSLDENQRRYLLKILNTRIFGFGAISKFLENDDIEEVAVIGIGKEKPVYIYEKCWGWLKTNVYFCNEDVIRALANRMARSLGRRLSMQTPKINAVLPDGSRLSATISPISLFGPTITIRKFRNRGFTPIELLENHTISSEALGFLSMALEIDCSIVICGNTGSGKTTTLNALLTFIPKNERIIVVEETPEIKPVHKHVVKINVVDELNIKMPHLIVDSLRMRPDRIVVGEIRNEEEVSAFIDTMLAGQGKGSYATFHAQSAEECITRLKNLGALEMDLTALDLIIVQRRWDDIDVNSGSRKEIRHIIEITEVLSENGKIKLNQLYKFDFKNKKLVKSGESKKLLRKMCECFNCESDEVINHIAKKEAKICSLLGKKLTMEEFFEIINS